MSVRPTKRSPAALQLQAAETTRKASLDPNLVVGLSAPSRLNQFGDSSPTLPGDSVGKSNPGVGSGQTEDDSCCVFTANLREVVQSGASHDEAQSNCTAAGCTDQVYSTSPIVGCSALDFSVQ